MQLKNFLKRNKALTVITVIFLIWVGFLTIFSFFARRNVIFYDALAQEDVSSEYSSEIPLLRYCIEPLVGTSSIVKDGFNWVIGFLLCFIALRISYAIAKKKGAFKSKKYSVLLYPLKDFVQFASIVSIIMLLAILSIIGVGWAIFGYYFATSNIVSFLQIGLTACCVIFILKAAIIAFKLIHPYFKHIYAKKISVSAQRKTGPPSKVKRYLHVTAKNMFYLVGITLLLLEVQLCVISTQFPTQKLSTDLDHDEFLFDFHVHTTYSDGWLSAEERVNWYVDQGISGAAFADHITTRGAKAAQKYVKDNDIDFVVFIAQEYTDHVNDIHMNFFGIEQTILPLEGKGSNNVKVLGEEDAIKYVKSRGGFVIVNHYNYDENPEGVNGMPFTLEELEKWGVDGFEIVNDGGLRDERIREFCLNRSLICLGGSDIHANQELNTVIKLRLDNPKDLSVHNVFENLRRNDHQVITIAYHPEKIAFPEILNDLGFDLLEDFVNYFLTINSAQILSWVVWSSGAFVIFVFFYQKLKKTDLTKLNAKIL